MDARLLAMMKHWEKLKVEDGILYRERRDLVSKINRLQLVLPVSLRDEAFKLKVKVLG